MARLFLLLFCMALLASCEGGGKGSTSTAETSGSKCYNAAGGVISCDDTGQDKQYTINPMSFTDNGNGTVTDNISGLIWQQQDDATIRTWSNAGTYCQNLSLGGHTDWRLPTERELMSIVKYGATSPSIDTTYFPSTASFPYWSSTTYDADKSNVNAWLVYFYNGAINPSNKANGYYVRCVR